MSDEAPETVSVPIPRPVAWLAGLPPLMGDSAQPELALPPTVCHDLEIRLAEIHGEISAETEHARAVRALILERLSERPCER